jgi:hypothetical protein
VSSLIINWRFFGWFLQVEPPRHWRTDGRLGRLSHVPGRPKAGEPWVEFYQGRGYFLALLLVTAAVVGWALA